jgi:hypothetical protein
MYNIFAFCWTDIFRGGKTQAAREANNLTATCEHIAKKMLKPRRLEALRTSTASTGRDTAFKPLPAEQTVMS